MKLWNFFLYEKLEYLEYFVSFDTSSKLSSK